MAVERRSGSERRQGPIRARSDRRMSSGNAPGGERRFAERRMQDRRSGVERRKG